MDLNKILICLSYAIVYFTFVCKGRTKIINLSILIFFFIRMTMTFSMTPLLTFCEFGGGLEDQSEHKIFCHKWSTWCQQIVEEQRPEKIQHRSNPTTQKVWQQIQIAEYPQITYSTFGSTNCGVSDLVRCDFWGGLGVFWSIKCQHFRTGLKLWKIISFYFIRQMG